MIVQTSLVHTAQVRARKIAWDGREVVQHGLNSDVIKLDLDAEWRECDRIQAVLAGAGEPVRILVEGGGFNLPSSLMERTGAIRMCLIGYVGETARIVTAKEAKPLIVVESGEMGGADPAPEQPDLWAKLMEEVRKATEGAKTAAQSATRAEADLRAAAERGDFDGEDGKTPVRGVDYWTDEDRKPIEDAADAALTSADKADAAAATATEGEASRVAAEAARAEAELARGTAETGRVEAEATRAANETKRTESFNTNLVSWNSKVDAACKKATDTASKAAQDAKTATDNATTAANKAEAAVSKLPLPLGNTLKGKVEATLVNVDDAYPAPLVTAKVMGQSNQQQEPAPSPENPQEITNLNKAELVVAGKNLINPNRLAQIDSAYYQAVDGQLKVIGSHNAAWKDVPIYGTLQAGTYTVSGDNIELRDAASNQIVNINSTQVNQFTLNNPTAIKMKIGYGWPKYPVISKVQLEVGSKATAYEPHQSTVTPIDLHGNELCSLPNGVKDEVVIDAEGNVSLIKRIGISPIPNCISVSDTANQTGKDGTLNYIVALETLADAKIGNGMPCMCNKLTDGGTSKNRDTVRLGANDNHVYVYTSNEQLLGDKSLAHIDNWMKSNEVTIIYELAEPQTIPLGKVELPALPESTSNVWNDGNIPANVYIQYLKDVNIAFADLESKLTQAVVAAAANL